MAGTSKSRTASPRSSKYALSPEQRDARREEAARRLVEQVGIILESDQYKRYLAIAGKFHNYSFGNILLMISQRPDISAVASFNKWKELGRHVKAGERGLVICVPMKGRGGKSAEASVAGAETSATDPGGADAASPARPRTWFGYRAAVFDVSQTEGDPLPEPPTPKLLDAAEDEVDIYLRLRACEAYAKEIGYAFRFDEVGNGSNGYASFDRREIVIKQDNPRLQQLKTAVHELAHARYHNEEERASRSGDQRLTRMSAELEAETTACLVCDSWGIDTADYSFPYLANWATNPEALVPAVDRARKMAAEVSQRLEWHIVANEEEYHLRGQEEGSATVLKCASAGLDDPETAALLLPEPDPEPIEFIGPSDDEVAALLGAPARVADDSMRAGPEAGSTALTAPPATPVARVADAAPTRPAGIPDGAVSIFDL